MQDIRLTGRDYVKFTQAVYLGPNGSSLSELSNWFQPIEFWDNSVILRQTEGGPCGLFAAFQAYIINEYFETGDVNADAIYKFGLDFSFKICRRFVFCVEFDDTQQFCLFKLTQNRKVAERFLHESRYFSDQRACLKFLLSLVFASVDLTALKVLPDPYVDEERFGAVALIWLVLNGSITDEALEKIVTGKLKALAEKRIGFQIIATENREQCGIWLNPDAKIFICLSERHFVVTAEMGTKGELQLFDCQAGPHPSKVAAPGK
jgi:hypothetical protein